MQDQPRLHIEGLAASGVAELSEDQVHYLGHVLRRAPGDEVKAFNASDGEWLARIDSLPRRGVGRLALVRQLRAPAPEAGPILLFAPVKRDATELIVRMATELGVVALWPVLTARTNAARVRIDRLAAIAVEAAEQCERLSVPEVAAPRGLARVLSDWPADRTLCVAIERAEGGGAARGDAVLIGPEGGFTPAELDVLHGHPFVTPISLGSRILRAETAAVAALVCLQGAREQWGATTP
ncbi:16S rRNA (uracil(1498)-N(3))-methyltransferase [Lichenicoccus sp.]|uniref:16S rRNA (uracil(1498)-N(3))-methyltransferase n=1 Tax=Lichenicoccus sp. TaxID=2781899 RepID=UPI003D12DBC9